MQLRDGPYKKNMNHPRKLPQRAECPGTWGSNCDCRQITTTSRNTSVKRHLQKDAITLVAILEKCSFSSEAHRGAGHRTLLVWLSAGRWSFSLSYDRDHWCCAIMLTLVSRTFFWGKESSSFNQYRSAPIQKDELMRCTCCLLYLRCDQQQLDANYRMPIFICSFSYTQSGKVSLARSKFRWSPCMTRSDWLKGNRCYSLDQIQWGKKVFSQPPIVQVLTLKKMREACNFHHRYTSTMRDKIRNKKSRKSHCRIF